LTKDSLTALPTDPHSLPRCAWNMPRSPAFKTVVCKEIAAVVFKWEISPPHHAKKLRPRLSASP